MDGWKERQKDEWINQLTLFFLGLRKKTVAPGASGIDEHIRNPTGSTDLFGTADAIVKHVLEVRTLQSPAKITHIVNKAIYK